MPDPKAVEVLHEQGTDKDEFVVKGYWDHEVKQGGFDDARSANAWATTNGFVVCIRPQPRDPAQQKTAPRY